MRYTRLAIAISVLALALAACSTAPRKAAQEEAAPAQLYILSNSSPHIAVIDTATNEVVNTADVPDFTSWTWNDDNNYFDGVNLWLGIRDKDTNEAEVIALNLDTLEVSERLSVGKEEKNLYIGQAGQNGIIHVGKMASAQVVTIDTINSAVLETWDVPVGDGEGGVVCDADVVVGSDGVERYYYPTRKTDMLVSINAKTGEVDKIVNTPENNTPHMLTVAHDGTVWVQEASSNTNAVFDPVSLDLIKRFPTGKGPVVASFSADGQYGYIGHFGDTSVLVVDTKTFEEVARVFVGNSPKMLAIHPGGKYAYAIVSKEASVAVINTEFWGVTKRITLENNPTNIFLRSSP